MQYFGVELPGCVLTPGGDMAWHKCDFPALLDLAMAQDWVILRGTILNGDFSPKDEQWTIAPEQRAGYRSFRENAVKMGISAAWERAQQCEPEDLIVPELVSAMEAFVCRRPER